ncbi:MAG: hypothetical protein ACK40V_03200 [Anaerolineales bacterium]
MGKYYTVALCGTDDNDNWLEGRDIYLTNDWQAIEIEWKAASAPSANDGYIKLWITEANYSDGRNFNYEYDAVGNRFTESNQSSVNSYQYDSANRLTSVNGVNYTFDDNGNLLSDGTNTYTYDSANRLISVSNPSSVNSYQLPNDKIKKI